MLEELSEHLDSSVPEEVLLDDSWDTKLLPDLDQLEDCNVELGYKDME